MKQRINLLGKITLASLFIAGASTTLSAQDSKEEERFQISVMGVEGEDEESPVQISVVDVKGVDEDKKTSYSIEDGKSKPFVMVEQMPQYPGGQAAMMKFLADSLQYPTFEAENGVQGRVIARFIVDEKGDVKEPTVIRSLSPNCDKESLRVIGLMPRWIPGKQNNKNVAVYYTIPILFKFRSENKETVDKK